ncbi:helix-turn-helix domain-containing protein [Paenibacillus sp. sptzw28]|uniref:helix-turn-helix domain-containing protein n=1 Tax=Paenibacillus sp. sptzw28 TaxID=715179 RepID=UPI0028693D24|nr:helix-turn-helix domain-containing protein [Paenibacillus sp. sptzw28]
MAKFLISYLLVLLFPVIVILFYYYPYSMDIVKEKQMEWNAHITDQVMNSMDIFTRYAYNLPSELVQNREMKLYMANEEDYQKVVISEEMRKYNATDAFIDNIFLYVKSTGYLFSKTGSAYSVHDFESPGVGYYYEDWPNMFEQLNSLSVPTVRPVENVIVPGKNRMRMLTFLLPLPLGGTSSPGSVLIMVREETIIRMMKSVSEAYNGDFFILDHKGNRLVSLRDTSYSHSDDFRKLISGLDQNKSGSGTYKMGGESYIVSHDVSDKNGWQYVSLIPVAETLQDIRTIQRNTVFLFILILLLEVLVIYVSIRKNYRPIKGLVSFARNMFLPNEQTKMNEIDTIRFALDQLSSDNSKLDERVRSTLPIMRENLLFELVSGHYTTWEDFQREAAPYGLSFNYPLVMVAVISCETEDNLIGTASDYFRMKENELPEGLQGYFFKSIYNHEIIFVCSGKQDMQLKTYLGCLQQELAIRAGIRSLIGIGSPEPSPEGVHLSYLQAVRAAEHLRIRKQYSVLVFEEIVVQQTGTVSYFAEQLQSLELFILKNDITAIESVLERIIDYIGNDGTPPHMVRTVYLNTITVILAGLDRFRQDDRSLLQLSEAAFHHRYTIEQMVGIMRESCGKLCDFIRSTVPPSRTVSIEEILAFIEKEGMNPDFSLQLIADHFGMSLSNFSYYFKKTMGQNFKVHIDRLRIQKSIELLRNTDETLESISHQIGYSNTSSFIRSFKKNIGTTPGQFRDLRM